MTILLALSISACSIQIKEMTPEPTIQKFDLADSESDGIINARMSVQIVLLVRSSIILAVDLIA